MRYVLLFVLMFSFSSHSRVNVAECISVRGDIGKTMLLAMEEDLNISKSALLKDKSEAEVISDLPVTFALAKTYGLQERKLSGEGSDDPATADDYAKGFMSDNARNLIIRYTFEDISHSHNILLASAFISDKDCIVRFNGYLIINREF